MRFVLCAICFIVASAQAVAGNIADCVIDNATDSQNDSAARAAMVSCKIKYPDAYAAIRQGSGAGAFGYDNGFECVMKEAKSTNSQLAGYIIGVACHCLYSKPDYKGQTCKQKFDARNGFR